MSFISFFKKIDTVIDSAINKVDERCLVAEKAVLKKCSSKSDSFDQCIDDGISAGLDRTKKVVVKKVKREEKEESVTDNTVVIAPVVNTASYTVEPLTEEECPIVIETVPLAVCLPVEKRAVVCAPVVNITTAPAVPSTTAKVKSLFNKMRPSTRRCVVK